MELRTEFMMYLKKRWRTSTSGRRGRHARAVRGRPLPHERADAGARRAINAQVTGRWTARGRWSRWAGRGVLRGKTTTLRGKKSYRLDSLSKDDRAKELGF